MKEAVSSGVGGRPVRSSETRRIRVRGSASGEGVNCSRASRACMKLSIGLRMGALASGTSGTGDTHRLVGPVAFIDGALRNPAADGIVLRRGEDLFRVLRRHAARGVGGEDALDDGALIRIARDDGYGPGSRRLQGFIPVVETHARHARPLIGTVAAKARIPT